MKKLSVLNIYISVTIFVVGWWFFAFKPAPAQPMIEKFSNASLNSSQELMDLAFLHIDRNQLQDALAGNCSLMARLIVEWDIDAQILQSSGLENINRISESDLMRSQYLDRQLKHAPLEKLKIAQEQSRGPFIIDDVGRCISLDRTFHSFLPQTYASASFLLALLSTDEIAALPRSMRDQAQLYPKKLTDQVPLDIDRQNAEKLFQKKPGIAFVAHYSHPATIQALINQGILIYTMKNLMSFSDITNELMQIGRIVNRPFQAELLKIFMEASLLAIDNRRYALTKENVSPQISKQTLLFLNHCQNFDMPTSKTLTGQLLQRMQVVDLSSTCLQEHEKKHEWTVPIDKERILNLNPDTLIIASQNRKALEKEVFNDPAFQQLSAVHNKRIYFVDEATQHSPTQYIVLAYYDLAEAIVHTP